MFLLLVLYSSSSSSSNISIVVVIAVVWGEGRGRGGRRGGEAKVVVMGSQVWLPTAYDEMFSGPRVRLICPPAHRFLFYQGGNACMYQRKSPWNRMIIFRYSQVAKFHHINLKYEILILPPYAFTLLKASFTDVLLMHTGIQSAQTFVN